MMKRHFPVLFLIGILLIPRIIPAQTALPDKETVRTWIEEMKRSPRGPFKRIRWFCKDGTVHPPKPYPCGDRGGGVQHGEWNDRVKILRANGYYIANVLADIDPTDFLRNPRYHEILEQILLEQFLITADDGWIFRRARYYRGALQAEDETQSSHDLLLSLVQNADWRNGGITVLREAVRLLPHKRRGALLTEIRQLSRAIAEEDEGFEQLRIKIHVRPDAKDADRVRVYAADEGRTELSEDYERLASAINEVYLYRETGTELDSLAGRVKDPTLAEALGREAAHLSDQNTPATRLVAAGRSLAVLRRDFDRLGDAELMLVALDVSLDVEREFFRSGNILLERLDETNRRERLSWLRAGIDGLYGVGLISSREWEALQSSLVRLDQSPLSLSAYRAELYYLSRAPEWADRLLRFHFSESIEHLATVEPVTRRYVHDRLHGSPMLFYAAVLESLLEDSNRLAGIHHELFGETTAGGLRGLNPGVARGILRFPGHVGDEEAFDRDGIYVLAATTDELPPVAGIVTAGEGNSLSHVQLLARNLGIPNVVVAHRLLPEFRSKEGRKIVLAVSPRGVVRFAEDSQEWDSVFGQEKELTDTLIRPDLAKLDLKTRRFLSLDRLRASDSGRIAGPKAANLGELKSRFPEAVPEGLVIPFGAFRAVLDQPVEPGGPSMFQWIQEQYEALQAIRTDPEKHGQAARRFLARLREWISNVDPGDDFRERLSATMAQIFGTDGSYGVFVRSDTNVEDLPGFTGAGLNLTVPNVVGFENVMKAITRVWASPFSDRAYAWRQAHMEHPEHVYVSVLLMKSVPADKSGVMVTVDLETGRSGWLSVAVNEGVGGAVAGQAAEELRVNAATGEIRLMTRAAEPHKRMLRSEGGVAEVPASGTESVLSGEEIARLIALARTVPDRFPALRDTDGQPVPADIEFGFHQGRLVLFQIRPFLESQRAQRSRFLNDLDRALDNVQTTFVNLDRVPQRGR